MPKGGPMAFLNKKTWHPGRAQNQEEVWKRQEAAAKEEQKLKDLQKQITEERAREEMHSIAEAAGVKIRSDRLDWMYQGGVAARQEANQRQEAATATTTAAPASVPDAGGAPGPSAPAAASLPAFYSEDTPATANEMWQRLHADPLFAIKQQEISARRNIVSNPVQMQAIKAQVRQLKGLPAEDEQHARSRDRDHKHKKDKKDRKEKKERRRHSSRDDRKRESEKRARRSESPLRKREDDGNVGDRKDDRDQGKRRDEHYPGGGGGGDREHDRDRKYDTNERRSSYRHEEDRLQRRERDEHRRDGGADRRDRRDRSRDRGRDRSRERSRDRSSRDRRQRRSRSRSRSPARNQQQQRHHAQDHNRQDDRMRPPAPRTAPAAAAAGNEDPHNGVKVHVDSASAQGVDTKYGISFASHVPGEVQHRDRSDFAEATRQRLEDAARKKEAEEREKAAQRYQKKEYRAGRMSEEEKQRRLAEMSSAANEHDEQRRVRLKEHAEKMASEEAEQQARVHTDTAGFLQAATKEVYGASGNGGANGASLADTVGRRKAFSQRT